MIKLIGIPYDDNSSFLKGPSLAPPLIRQMDTDGSANSFSESGKEIVEGLTYHDVGDLPLEGMNREEAYRFIKNAIQNELVPDHKILSLGGDHSVSFPIIEAFCSQYNNLHVLHLDAHADLYENLDNNPYSHASPFARLLEKGLLKSLTQVGIRTLNTHQREQAERYGVKIVEMKNFSNEFISSLHAPLYISLDLDVLDPAYVPGISHYEPGGLSTRELISIIQTIKVPVVGADIVEYNPNRDFNSMTAMVGYKLMKELMSKMLD